MSLRSSLRRWQLRDRCYSLPALVKHVMREPVALLATHEAAAAEAYNNDAAYIDMVRASTDAARYAKSAVLRWTDDEANDIASSLEDISNADLHVEYVALRRRVLAGAAEGDRPKEAARLCAALELLPSEAAAATAVCRDDGYTILMAACASGRGAADVVALVEARADPRSTVARGDSKGRTPLHYAALAANTPAVVALLGLDARRRPDPNARDHQGRTALHVAATEGAAEAAGALLAGGANLNAETDHGVTPLFIAAQNGREAAVRALLFAGADIERLAKGRGTTALIAAATFGHTAVVSAMLDAGARARAATRDGLTPLLMAAQNGHAATVAVLLAGGADVDAANREGATPLHIAAHLGHVEVVQELCKAGPNLGHMAGGVTALQAARRQGHNAIIRHLLELGGR